jgi:prepilin-type N-terminal cleavage/methylation domain-containing protein/prepilin-type processing-associated H-X9-DG protein
LHHQIKTLPDATFGVWELTMIVSRNGFTLIELLAVLVILAILAAISLSSVKSVMEAAKATRCASNLRQYGVAILNYTGDMKGILPPGLIRGVDVLRYGANGAPTLLIRNDYIPRPKLVTSGTPVTRAMGTIFDCPAALNNDVTLIANYPFCSVAANATSDICQGFIINNYYYNSVNYVATNSYTLNCLGPYAKIPFTYVNSTTPQKERDKYLSSLAQPSSLAMLWDGNVVLNTAIARITARHYNRTKTNVLFADGHTGIYSTFTQLHPQYKNNSTTGEFRFFIQ